MHKAGFISILGYPNVGKSTLVNSIIGENLMPVSPKAQTTRQRVLGIYNDEKYTNYFFRFTRLAH